jgi:predicted thioesterase
MREEHEEGIGTMLHIQHQAPAFVGETVTFTGTLAEVNGNEVICSFQARVGIRVIANGQTGQRVLAKSKIDAAFEKAAL